MRSADFAQRAFTRVSELDKISVGVIRPDRAAHTVL